MTIENKSVARSEEGAQGCDAKIEECRRTTEVIAVDRRLKFDRSLKASFLPPDSHRIHQMIMSSSDLQLSTTREARAIVAAGLEFELRALICAISANASCGIAAEFEHYLEIEDGADREG
jgi:hypothetical protein